MRPWRLRIPKITLALAAAILLISAIAAERIRSLHRQAVSAQMEANVDTLANLLRSMQHNYLEASAAISGNPEFHRYARRVVDHPNDAVARDQLDAWAHREMSTYGFAIYSVYSPDFVIVAAYDPVFLGAHSGLPFFGQLKRDGFAISYPFRTRRTTAASLAAGRRDYVQLACHVAREGGQVLGYFCLGSDPRQLLFPLVSSGWSGKTGEAYLIDSHGHLRTPSRFEASVEGDPKQLDDLEVSRLLARVPSRTAPPGEKHPLPSANDPLSAMAASLLHAPTPDFRFLDGYTDYRGRQVVGAGKWLPEFGLGLITEIDENEVYGSATLAMVWVWGLAILAAAFLLLISIRAALARRALAVSEAQLSSFFSNAPVSMHIQTAEGRFLRTNPTFEMVNETLQGPHTSDQSTPMERSRSEQRQQVIASGKAIRFDAPTVALDGTERCFHVVRFPIALPADDELLGVGTIGVDVTTEMLARRELEKLADRLESDVAERTAELSEARDAAETAGRAKAEFLANMSHEIRTPLNAITGMSHLASRLNTDPRIAHYLQRIDAAGSHLLSVVNDILDFSKIEADRIELELATFSPEQVLQDVVALIGPRAGAKGLELLLSIHEDVPPRLVGDAMRIGQILINFVANAVKFTDKGSIELRVICADHRESTALLRFEVEDTGSGIAPEQLARLFQPFTQVDGSRRRTHEGTGLGLAISKRLAERMDGRVRAISRVGTGSTFILELPLAIAADPVPQAATPALSIKRALVVDDNLRSGRHTISLLHSLGIEADLASSAAEALRRLADGAPGAQTKSAYDALVVDADCDADPGDPSRRVTAWPGTPSPPRSLMLIPPSGEPPAHIAPATIVLAKPLTRTLLAEALGGAPGRSAAGAAGTHDGSDSLRGLHVLLVEDNEVNSEVATDLLNTRGVRVTVAQDGMRALHMIGRQAFDLVLMDVHMPVIDGIEATRSLRRDPALRSLPIIGLSASVQPVDRARALAAGMNAFVGKPIVPAELFAAIEKWGRPVSPQASAVATESLRPENADSLLLARLRDSGSFDVESAVARLLGRPDLYAKLVRRVVRDDVWNWAVLSTALTEQRLDDAARLVHNFGSIAGSLGADALRLNCLEVETGIRAGRMDGQRMDALRNKIEALAVTLGNAVA